MSGPPPIHPNTPKVSERVLLAYSGSARCNSGLHYLVSKGHKVVCWTAILSEEGDRPASVDEVKAMAKKIGAEDAVSVDLRKAFVTEFVFPAMQSLSNTTDLFSVATPLAYTCIARYLAKYAVANGFTAMAHCANPENDGQLHLDLTCAATAPAVQVIPVMRDSGFAKDFATPNSHMQLVDEKGWDSEHMKWAKARRTILCHSHHGGQLDVPSSAAKQDVFTFTKAKEATPDKPTQITLTFVDGAPVKLTDHAASVNISEPANLLQHLNKIAADHGIGRHDFVDDNILGVKTRWVSEAPGGLVLLMAQKDIEDIAMDREVHKIRNMLSPKFCELVKSGLWFSPEMEFLSAALTKSQQVINGEVVLDLLWGNADVVSRSCPSSLFENRKEREQQRTWNFEDASGYIQVQANRLQRQEISAPNP